MFICNFTPVDRADYCVGVPVEGAYKRILTNYKYKGFYCGKKSEVINYKISKRRIIDEDKWIVYRDYDSIPPIVEEDVWNEVNNIIDKRKNTYRDFTIYLDVYM